MVQYLVAPGDSGGKGTDMNRPELPTSQNVQLTQRGVRRYSATYGRGGIRRHMGAAEFGDSGNAYEWSPAMFGGGRVDILKKK